MGTILVSGVLLVIVAAIVRGFVKDKKQGKSVCGCGGNCAHCSKCCH